MKQEKYTEEEISGELVRRLKDEALELIVSIGPLYTFHQFEEKWNELYPNESYFL